MLLVQNTIIRHYRLQILNTMQACCWALILLGGSEGEEEIYMLQPVRTKTDHRQQGINDPS